MKGRIACRTSFACEQLMCFGFLTLSHLSPPHASAVPQDKFAQQFDDSIRAQAAAPATRTKQLEKILTDAEKALAQAQARGDREREWNALMTILWVHYNRSDYLGAVTRGNEALAVAQALKSDFALGRTLAFLGSSFQGMGLYKAAIYFYDRAIAIGKKGDVIEFPHVWGIATQEKGAILARMGDLSAGRELLRTTLQYARKHNIPFGVAESAAWLGGAELAAGDLESAEEYADEALSAALRMDVVPRNTARAKTLVAKVRVARSETDPARRSEAQSAVEESIRYSESGNIVRYLAESLRLQARLLPATELSERLRVATRARELLVNSLDETRGTAEAAVGTVLAAGKDRELARSYLERGYEINREPLREVDNAYVSRNLADLHEL